MHHLWLNESCCWVESVDVLSFSAWLEGEEDPVIERVNQRIEDITGLTTQTAELLQVPITYIIHTVYPWPWGGGALISIYQMVLQSSQHPYFLRR